VFDGEREPAGGGLSMRRPTTQHGASGNILIDRFITKYIIHFVIAMGPERVELFDK
jgi:hypothetical protein